MSFVDNIAGFSSEDLRSQMKQLLKVYYRPTSYFYAYFCVGRFHIANLFDTSDSRKWKSANLSLVSKTISDFTIFYNSFTQFNFTYFALPIDGFN